MSQLNIFVPLTKVDVENRLVYGVVAEEVVDNSGEMFDYEKSKPFFQKWSANAELTSGGLSKGNLRAMHGKVAAGKLTDLGFDDENRRIECCAKVVDDNEWKKCLEGVYTGFSMGGRYAQKWVEKSDNGMDIKRYAGDPAEISLVDKPCIPTATFTMVKADGVVEECHFTTVITDDQEISPSAEKSDNGGELMTTQYIPTNDEISARSVELAKAAGKTEGEWSEFIETARENLISEHLAKADASEEKKGDEDKGDFDKDEATGPKEDEKGASGDDDKGEEDDEKSGKEDKTAEKSDNGDWDTVDQVWKAKDGKTFDTKKSALNHNKALKKAAEAAEKPDLLAALGSLQKTVEAVQNGETGDQVEEETVEKSDLENYADFFDGFAKMDHEHELQKGMYEVERTARVLREVASLQIAVSREQKREGDDSQLPSMIGIAVGQLGDTLIAMAKEEVDELMLQVARDGGPEVPMVSDCYYELAASTLGLEKSDFDEMAKAAVSKKAEYVQKMHDRLSKMGAKCAGDEMGKVDGGDELAKMAGEMDELRKRAETAESQIETAMPLIKSLQADIEAIKKMPLPQAPRTSVVEKSDDGKAVAEVRAETAEDLLKKFTPDQLADAAFRVAQKNGISMTSRGRVD